MQRLQRRVLAMVVLAMVVLALLLAAVPTAAQAKGASAATISGGGPGGLPGGPIDLKGDGEPGSGTDLANLAEARRRGATACTLEVRVANHAAQGLYHQFGFAPVGIRKNYYAETGEDALIMWAEGLQTPAYAERLAGLAARIPEPREL